MIPRVPAHPYLEGGACDASGLPTVGREQFRSRGIFPTWAPCTEPGLACSPLHEEAVGRFRLEGRAPSRPSGIPGRTTRSSSPQGRTFSAAGASRSSTVPALQPDPETMDGCRCFHGVIAGT